MSKKHQISLHSGRLFALVWLGVYPMITFVFWLTGPMLRILPLPVQTLVLSGLMVGYMVFLWMPFIQRFSST